MPAIRAMTILLLCSTSLLAQAGTSCGSFAAVPGGIAPERRQYVFSTTTTRRDGLRLISNRRVTSFGRCSSRKPIPHAIGSVNPGTVPYFNPYDSIDSHPHKVLLKALPPVALARRLLLIGWASQSCIRHCSLYFSQWEEFASWRRWIRRPFSSFRSLSILVS